MLVRKLSEPNLQKVRKLSEKKIEELKKFDTGIFNSKKFEAPRPSRASRPTSLASLPEEKIEEEKTNEEKPKVKFWLYKLSKC